MLDRCSPIPLFGCVLIEGKEIDIYPGGRLPDCQPCHIVAVEIVCAIIYEADNFLRQFYFGVVEWNLAKDTDSLQLRLVDGELFFML